MLLLVCNNLFPLSLSLSLHLFLEIDPIYEREFTEKVATFLLYSSNIGEFSLSNGGSDAESGTLERSVREEQD